MELTWLDNNSWLIQIGEQRILLDPWLVGPLVFGNLPWFFQAERKTPCSIPENINLILLSQGLEDHAHPETLQQLNHNLPVIASPNATKIVQQLGYNQITTLAHQQTFTFANHIEITAVPGSLVGPNLVENGYIIKDLETGQTLYYEPHGSHSPSLQKMSPIDIIITPIVNLKLPLGGAIIKGQKSALEVCKWLTPKAIFPTAAGEGIIYSGLLNSFLTVEGNLEQFQNLLTENNLSTQVLNPKPWQTTYLSHSNMHKSNDLFPQSSNQLKS